MDKEEELSAVFEELDSLSIRMLQLMKEYIDIKSSLEDFMKAGTLHLAKARYILGSRSVSVLQLPTEASELNATAKVVRGQELAGEFMILNRVSLNKAKQDVEEQDGLKQRRTEKDSKEDEQDNKTEGIQKNGMAKDKAVMQDPLKWFGLLVPQNLRSAQSVFCTAVDYAIQCANIQTEMCLVEKNYRLLKARKNELTKPSKVEVVCEDEE